MSIGIGDMLRIKSPKHNMDKKQSITFKFNNPKAVGLFLFMGTGDIDKPEDDISPDDFLRRTGWSHEEQCGWVVKNGSDKMYRTWVEGTPTWTHDVKHATRYARREDAEAVHHDDEDAWSVVEYRLELT